MLPRKSQSCENCDAWMHQRGDDGLCRAEPPLPIMIGMGQAAVVVGQAQVQPVIQSYFPPMMKKGWCRCWALKTNGEA